MNTLVELSELGPRISGTERGQQAAEYVARRFEEAGIEDVTFDPFDFPAFVTSSHSFQVSIDGAPVAMEYEVFHYSGPGDVMAEVVDAGTAHEASFADLDVNGKVVLVQRDPMFHRQSQLREVFEHGGVAMLYVSTSPENLIQIGTVSEPGSGLADAPAVTVGADDGARIREALAAGKSVTAHIAVAARLEPAVGRNVIARVPGLDPSGAYILVGAHFDAWYAGATDNGTGVAALLEIAERVAHGERRRLGVVFVGYDAEELGLFGGYDFLRQHIIAANEPALAFVNFEMPAAGPANTGLRALAHTNEGPIDPALREASIDDLYSTYLGMEVVPVLFGGLVPTDIQGMYWNGLQGFTTYCETGYYHTRADTPEKVDVAFLGESILAMEQALLALDDAPIMSFDGRDPQLWYPNVTTTAQSNGDLEVAIVATDAAGTAQPDATIQVLVDVDDFSRAHRATATTDDTGRAVVTIPAAALAAGSGSRWLHVRSGVSHPLHEHVQQLP